MPKTDRTTRPFTLFATAIIGILGSGLLGGMTNAFNAWISPHYFVTVLRWHYIERIWLASIAEGIFEGLLFGVGFSLFFTLGLGCITRASCPLGFALRHLGGILIGSLICWALGGTLALCLVHLSPEFYQERFPQVPEDFHAMIRFAWVGGSIWGVEIGGILSSALILLLAWANWTQPTESN